MNPEENNPLANPGMPDYSANNPGGIDPGATNTDNNNTYAPTSMTATSAMPTFGAAATPTATDSPAFAPLDEPLTPAAPVPGSIGSVTSVPLTAAEPMANPFAPTAETAAPAAALADDAAAPATNTAASAPYNPFAPASEKTETSSPAASTTPAAAAPAAKPAFQPTAPAAAAKVKKPIDMLTILLGALSAILLITTVVFAVLYFNAKNNPKIVYVPTTSEDDSNSRLQILTCSTSHPYELNPEFGATLYENTIATFTDSNISGLRGETQVTLPTEQDAINARDAMLGLFAMSGNEAFPTLYEPSIDGTTLHFNIRPQTDPLTADAAAFFIYGNDTTTARSVTMEDVKAYYESLGGTCTIE